MEMLPREVVEAPSTEVYKIQVDEELMGLSLVLVALEAGLDASRSTFQPACL